MLLDDNICHSVVCGLFATCMLNKIPRQGLTEVVRLLHSQFYRYNTRRSDLSLHMIESHGAGANENV